MPINEALANLGMMANNTNIKSNLAELADIMQSGGDRQIRDINLKKEIELIYSKQSTFSANQRRRLLILWERIQKQQK